MIVIGDAAHAPAPSSGQGASMAMEDGVQLAIALRDHADIEGAFGAYERLVARASSASSRRAPGAAARRRPAGSADWSATRSSRIAFRYLITERSLAWMYDYRIEWRARADTRRMTGPNQERGVDPFGWCRSCLAERLTDSGQPLCSGGPGRVDRSRCVEDRLAASQRRETETSA
jgi:hypothetical protein